MQIRLAEKEDLADILKLQYLAFQSEARLCNDPNIPPLTQTPEEIQAEFENGVFLKATDENGDIIASVRAFSENGTLHIGKLMVHPDLQGQGIGTRMLNEMEQTCPHDRYEMFTSEKSERNIMLYGRLGYRRYKEQNVGGKFKIIYLAKDNVR